jgi:AcrR family transcriptional regulator
MDNRDKIMEASLRLFIKEGFHGTSTSKIANEAGVSNGTLFHYFKTKEELINKLYLRIKEGYYNYLLEHIKTCKTSRSKLYQLWLGCVHWSLENSDCEAFFAMFSNSPYIDKLSKEEASRNFSFIHDIFQEAIDQEILINVNTDLISNTFYASTKAFSAFISDNPGKLDEYMDIAFKMWWRSAVNF